MNTYIIKPGMDITDLGELLVVNPDTNTPVASIYPPIDCNYAKMDRIITEVESNTIIIRKTFDGYVSKYMDIFNWIDVECNRLADLL